MKLRSLFLNRRGVCTALLLVGLSGTGCRQSEDPMLALMDVDVMSTRIDDLGRTVDFVRSERRFDQREFEDKVASGLNRWSDYSQDTLSKLDWSLDSIVQPLTESFSSLPDVQKLDELSFSNTDAWFLQQSQWIGAIVERVTAAKDETPFELYRLSAGVDRTVGDLSDATDEEQKTDPVELIFQTLHPDLSEQDAAKLTQAVKLLDWVVRNIQLLPAEEANSEAADEYRLNDAEQAAAAGVPGLGYQRFPWQTLMFGRGDYVDRAKLLVLMLEQAEVPAAMLATGSSEPWAVGAKIGEQVYLFDTKLGLPIPGKQSGQIATLADVRDDKSLLASLDLTVEESLADETDYWVKGEDAKQLTALVYASPEGLSRRMAALEARLTGDDRLLLTSRPSKLAAAFQIAGVEVQPWDIAFQTHQFRGAVRDAIAKSSFDDTLANRLSWYFTEEAYIDQFTRYRTSRARFFGGRFNDPADARSYNAIESFQHLMYRDEVIDELGSDQKLQRGLGILRDREQSANEYQNQLAGVQSQMRMVRRDAGFFLAQSHFDNGSVSTAANWLERLQAKDDVERWSDGIDYLLARALEGRKDYLNSIELYRDSESAQSHGNLIRARLLSQQVDKL